MSKKSDRFIIHKPIQSYIIGNTFVVGIPLIVQKSSPELFQGVWQIVLTGAYIFALFEVNVILTAIYINYERLCPIYLDAMARVIELENWVNYSRVCYASDSGKHKALKKIRQDQQKIISDARCQWDGDLMDYYFIPKDLVKQVIIRVTQKIVQG